MKNAFMISLLLLMFFSAQGIFSQVHDTTTISSPFINDLSIKVAKSPIYASYAEQVKKMITLSARNVGSQLPTEENKVYGALVDKINGDNTLSELERSDSLQNVVYTRYRVPKADIDSFNKVKHELYKAFPELVGLSQQAFRSVQIKANALITPSNGRVISKDDYIKVFTEAQRPATFPGGMELWRRYLERNLDANVAARDGAPAGLYPVKLQFTVDTNGTVSNVKAVEVPQACPHCGPEAVRIMSRTPKWIPAVQDGQNVVYQGVQFITFVVGR